MRKNPFQSAVDLGAELRRLRRSLDLTQIDVARRARTSQASLSRVESGRPGTAPEIVARIVAVIDAAAREKGAKR